MKKQLGNDEHEGEWLQFRMRSGRVSMPAKISRKALEDHFGGLGGERSLAFLYASNTDAIHSAARAKVRGSGPGSTEHPVELCSADFTSSSGIFRPVGGRLMRMTNVALQKALEQVASSGQGSESAAGNYVLWQSGTCCIELAGTFSVDQLELMASWIREAFGDCATPAEGGGDGQPPEESSP